MGDRYTIDISHINLDYGKTKIGESENILSVYGVANSEYAFKNQYKLSSEQVTRLTKGTQTKIIKAFGEIFESLELTKHDFSDFNTVTLGLKTEQDLKTLTKLLGPAIPSNSLFKNDYNTTPDNYMPVYSRVGVVEKDGKTYAVLDIEAIEMHYKNEPNIGMGFLWGSSMYGATENLTTAYISGMTMAYATAIKETNAYARVDRVVTEIDATTAAMSKDELRDYIVKGMLKGNIDCQKQTIKLSENISNNKNKYYNEVFEK